MALRPFRAVIFDLNGVVVDDIPYHKKAWIELSAARGVVLTEEEFETRISGRNNREILHMLFDQNMSEDEMERFSVQAEALYRKIYAPQRALLPGIERFLRALKTAGVPTAVATGAPPDNIPFIMEHFDLYKYFNAIVGAIEVNKGKPNPEIYLLAASRLGVVPEECLVFEDALLGIQAARSAGMQVIGIATTHEASELEGTELVVADFEKLSLHDCKEPEAGGLPEKLFCIRAE